MWRVWSLFCSNTRPSNEVLSRCIRPELTKARTDQLNYTLSDPPKEMTFPSFIIIFTTFCYLERLANLRTQRLYVNRLTKSVMWFITILRVVYLSVSNELEFRGFYQLSPLLLTASHCFSLLLTQPTASHCFSLQCIKKVNTFLHMCKNVLTFLIHNKGPLRSWLNRLSLRIIVM